jgi:hypothetical protein
MRMTAIWVIAPYIFVEVHRRFGVAYCTHHPPDMEEVSMSETPVYFNERI